MTRVRTLLALVAAFFLAAPHLALADVSSGDAKIEQRVMALSEELRCLVCQNQSLADSHAELALDLRNQIREQVVAGKSDKEIVDYLVARYGDFVLYRPPVSGATAFLWAGPFALMVLGVAVLIFMLRKRQSPALDSDDLESEEDGPERRTSQTQSREYRES